MMKGKNFGEKKFKESRFQDFGKIIYVYIKNAEL
jgi:hypothetical protein